MSPSPDDRVERLVSGPPIEVNADDTLVRVAELMAEDSIGLVVVRGGEPLAGVVSERDIVVAVAEGVDLDADRAGDLMTLQTMSVEADRPVSEAARMMVDGGVRHLPVTNGDRVVGVLSMRDVLAAYVG